MIMPRYSHCIGLFLHPLKVCDIGGCHMSFTLLYPLSPQKDDQVYRLMLVLHVFDNNFFGRGHF